MELDHTSITIWQQNINKSPICQHDLISSKSLIDLGANIVALQELAINPFNKMIATKDWTPMASTWSTPGQFYLSVQHSHPTVGNKWTSSQETSLLSR